MPTQLFDSEISLGVLTSATLRGKITGLIVREKDENGILQDTNNIMRTDRDWQIMLTWKLFGTVLDMMAPPHMGPITAALHGNFLINAYLEGLGSRRNTDEMELPGDTVGGVPVMGGAKAIVNQGARTKADPTAVHPTQDDPLETEWQYNETITIRAEDPNAKPARPRLLKPGPYKLAVTLTYEQPDVDRTTGIQKTDSAGNPLFKPGPMAGFMELPDLIQIYDPGTS